MSVAIPQSRKRTNEEAEGLEIESEIPSKKQKTSHSDNTPSSFFRTLIETNELQISTLVDELATNKPAKVHPSDAIREGDLVCCYLKDDEMKWLKVTIGEALHCRFGVFSHDDMIGKAFGSKLVPVPTKKEKEDPNNAKKKKGVYLMRPNVRLWTRSVPHRTQIIYRTDISVISSQLHLKPGCIVIEAGTGSGSLSHSILKTIAPSGHLYTCEFHKERHEKATKEFQENGFEELVTTYHRDVCAFGFPMTGAPLKENEKPELVTIDPNSVDAVFLDLPKPWECVSYAHKVLKPNGGRICCFSPCIEQVQQNADNLRELDFGDIQTFECLCREHWTKGNPEFTRAKQEEALLNFDDPFANSLGTVGAAAQSKNDRGFGKSMKNKEEKTYVKCAPESKGHTAFVTFGTKFF